MPTPNETHKNATMTIYSNCTLFDPRKGVIEEGGPSEDEGEADEELERSQLQQRRAADDDPHEAIVP